MKRAIKFVCLVAAGFAFLTFFTFSQATEQVVPRERPEQQEPRLTRPLSADPGKSSSGPLQQQQPEAPKGSSGPLQPVEPPKEPSSPLVPSGAKKKYEPAKFVQVKRDDNGKPLSLQTAIVGYAPANPEQGQEGLTVDLVSVVHIADRKYYDKLNTRFEDYDVVLFELVMPKGAKIPKGGPKGSGNPISMLQDLMTMMLQLDLQTRCIDYTCTNFVHADLSPEEMAESIKKKGDNAFTLTLSILADMMKEQNKMQQKPLPGADLDPFKLLTDPQAPAKLKVIMAEQLELMADGTGLGKTLNQLLIDERNAACMKVLEKQIAAGKKKIAIFYGAAHMPDFERRLIEDFGMQRQKTIWYDAWNLGPTKLNPLDMLKYLN